MKTRLGSNTLNQPMKIVVTYLCITLFLYAVGPFEWVTYKPLIFWCLNITYILMFVAGWCLGGRVHISSYEWNSKSSKIITKYLKYLITINFLCELINAFRRFRLNTLNIFTLINSIIEGMSNMGGAYNEFQESIGDAGVQVLGGNLMTYFNLIWAFVGFNILMIGVLYFKQLSKYNKTVLIMTYILIALEYIATGTNIGVFRLILVFVIFGGIKLVREGKKKKIRMARKKKRKFILVTIIALIIILFIFDKIMQSRGGILLWESSYYNVGGIHVDKDSFLFKIVPPSFHMLLVSGCAYLTQGYYGMSLCLQIPWKFGFGVGHCMAFMNLFNSALTVPHENTYQYRLTSLGWEEGTQWHTMYSWFANDITFIGVIIIMFIIGLAFSVAYRDSVLTNNPYAKLVTYYFALMAFFIPCNNQLFQSVYILFAFWTAIVLWLCTRGRKKIVFTIGGKRF